MGTAQWIIDARRAKTKREKAKRAQEKREQIPVSDPVKLRNAKRAHRRSVAAQPKAKGHGRQ